MTEFSAQWDSVDQFWDRYVQYQESGLIDLHRILETLNREWNQRAGQFDADPLAINWSSDLPQAGPLRTGQEENWSRWLAEVLRDSAGPYAEALFESIDGAPTSVRCERAFHDEELHDRRVDIIAEDSQSALSIEVKIEDEHYEKTGQAAYLAEKHDPDERTWTHYLLLPRSKREALQEAFEGRMNEAKDGTVIEAANDQERPINVLYWSKVARESRRCLLTDQEPSDHWNASAYLFTTLIEQQIMDFYPQPAIERAHNDTIGIGDVHRIQSIDPEHQLEYLTEIVEAITNG